jgi:hypothetical protein
MSTITRNYLTHGTVQMLFLALAAGLYGCVSLQLTNIGPWILLVIATAPFYEWVTHKFMLHRPLTEKAGRWQEMQIKLHHGHHYAPENVSLQFAPAWAVVANFLQLYVFYVLVCLLIGLPTLDALVPLTASIAYYLFYEWIHLAHHTIDYRPKTAWGRRVRQAHMYHHFHNENENWGITNMFADRILGTLQTPQTSPKSPTARTICGYPGENISEDLRE